MPGKHNAGGCGCCGDTCENCTGITYVTIGGMSSGSVCTSGCENKNGTYVFRSAGGSPCGTYQINLGGSNCGHSCVNGDTDQWFIGDGCCLLGPTRFGITVVIENNAGKIKITVHLFAYYSRSTVDCDVGVTAFQCGNYRKTWIQEFTNCADISGTSLSVSSTSGAACTSDPDTGDLCGIHGATASVG